MKRPWDSGEAFFGWMLLLLFSLTVVSILALQPNTAPLATGSGAVSKTTQMSEIAGVVEMWWGFENTRRAQLHLDKADRDSITFVLDYPKFENTAVAFTDTREVARLTLKALMAEGHRPSEEQISIWVYAYQDHIKGETGVDLVRSLGSTRYDYGSDSLIFEPAAR